MTQDDTYDPAVLGETIDTVLVRLEELLAQHTMPGRTMVLAVVVAEDGVAGGNYVTSGEGLLEGAEGLEILAAQLRGQD